MKKILNRLLSRMVITCFLVVVQLAIMILGVVFLQDRYIYISGALKLLSVIVVDGMDGADTHIPGAGRSHVCALWTCADT